MVGPLKHRRRRITPPYFIYSISRRQSLWARSTRALTFARGRGRGTYNVYVHRLKVPSAGDRLARGKRIRDFVFIGAHDYRHFPALPSGGARDNHRLSGFPNNLVTRCPWITQRPSLFRGIQRSGIPFARRSRLANTHTSLESTRKIKIRLLLVLSSLPFFFSYKGE